MRSLIVLCAVAACGAQYSHVRYQPEHRAEPSNYYRTPDVEDNYGVLADSYQVPSYIYLSPPEVTQGPNDNTPWVMQETSDEMPWVTQRQSDNMPWVTQRTHDNKPWVTQSTPDNRPWVTQRTTDNTPWVTQSTPDNRPWVPQRTPENKPRVIQGTSHGNTWVPQIIHDNTQGLIQGAADKTNGTQSNVAKSVENNTEDKNVEVETAEGAYYVLLPESRLQRVLFKTENDAQNMAYTAQIQYKDADRVPIFVYTAGQHEPNSAYVMINKQ